MGTIELTMSQPDVSLGMPYDGALLAIYGAAGSGKTTLIRHLVEQVHSKDRKARILVLTRNGDDYDETIGVTVMTANPANLNRERVSDNLGTGDYLVVDGFDFYSNVWALSLLVACRARGVNVIAAAQTAREDGLPMLAADAIAFLGHTTRRTIQRAGRWIEVPSEAIDVQRGYAVITTAATGTLTNVKVPSA